MAWNQVTLTLLPPRWSVSTTGGSEGIRSGGYVCDQSHGLALVDYLSPKAWLQGQGFLLPEGETRLFKYDGKEMGCTVLSRHDIEITLYSLGEELVNVGIRYTLPRWSPPVEQWEAFTNELCRQWQLSFLDWPKAGKVSADRFRTMLEQHPNWEFFASDPDWLSATLAAAVPAASSPAGSRSAGP